ncbi:MAG TPA: hypothetical protein PL067_09490 [Bacteroidales bacterium]|nr:hypothetical protein [Candidatus Fermentibacter daniensis]HPO40943.1 hypothetical protein [Bacteroidales bacterium]
MVSKEDVQTTIERLGSRIPEELRQLKQWVLIRAVAGSDGKTIKEPYVASTFRERKASSTNPDDWESFEVATNALQYWKGWFDFIAFVITEDDPYVFIDFDHVLEDRVITYPKVEKHVSDLASYTEVSLSGTGLHVFTKAIKNSDRCRNNKPFDLEVYDHARFAVMTGNIWSPSFSTITEGQAALDELCDLYLSPTYVSVQSEQGAEIPTMADDNVLSLCKKRIKSFVRLWSGDTRDYDDDESRADFALCCMLAKFSSDPDQVDRLFRQSELMRPKWDSKRGSSTYGRKTVEKAIRCAKDRQTDRPKIVLNNRQLDSVVDSSIEALSLNTFRPIYIRANRLCEVRNDEKNNVSIIELDDDRLLARLGECADWLYVDRNGTPTAKFPPTYVARVIIAKGEGPFPVLHGLSYGPFFRPDGALVAEQGYDLTSGRYLHLKCPLDLRGIPDLPSKSEVAEAVSVLDELLHDFPFADAASRASAIALLVQPCVRDVVDSFSPLALFDSPTPGSGKGLLCRCCSVIHTGDEPTFSPPPTSESEWKKTILSILASGHPSVVFDNVDQEVRSASLCAVLTARSFSDRYLGKTLFVEYPNDALWHLTGNNIKVAADVARRSFWIRFLPHTDRPQKRTDFIHPDLISWVGKNRSTLLWAILVLVRSWFASGKPKPAIPPMGGYERWCEVIGGILENAGIEGFMSNSDALWNEVNADSSSWQSFLSAWWDFWHEAPVTTKELLETLELDGGRFEGCIPDVVADALQGLSASSKVSRLGKALTKYRDRRFGDQGFHLSKSHRSSKGANWVVEADKPELVESSDLPDWNELLDSPTSMEPELYNEESILLHD